MCKSSVSVSVKIHKGYVTLGMQNEKWKPVPGYEGLYIVSNKGRIYGLKKRRELKAAKMNKGYAIVTLWKDNEQCSTLVHRLVAQAFIPNPDNLPQVNHKDTNKMNNYVSNLEWSTCQQNIIHAVQMGVFKRTCANLSQRKIQTAERLMRLTLL